MATAPIILLPPSEGKASGGRRRPRSEGSLKFPALDAARSTLMTQLTAAMEGSEADVAKLLGVKGAALAQACSTNRVVGTAKTLPAIERYTGVLYDALDYPTLPAESRRRANRQIIIFSGLWGLVTPTDNIPDYKLKMGASLTTVGRLASYWRPHIASAIAPALKRRTVWDLLPLEHASAWNPSDGDFTRRITVRFFDDVPHGNERKLVTVAHWNKLLKGALVRHILETQLTDPDGLVDFRHPEGYTYDKDLTQHTDRGIEVGLVATR